MEEGDTALSMPALLVRFKTPLLSMFGQCSTPLSLLPSRPIGSISTLRPRKYAKARTITGFFVCAAKNDGNQLRILVEKCDAALSMPALLVRFNPPPTFVVRSRIYN